MNCNMYCILTGISHDTINGSIAVDGVALDNSGIIL